MSGVFVICYILMVCGVCVFEFVVWAMYPLSSKLGAL